MKKQMDRTDDYYDISENCGGFSFKFGFEF